MADGDNELSLPPARVRARKACKVCNARRVRCNAVEVQPCDNCRAAGIRCEWIESRRGKYNRYNYSYANQAIRQSPPDIPLASLSVVKHRSLVPPGQSSRIYAHSDISVEEPSLADKKGAQKVAATGALLDSNNDTDTPGHESQSDSTVYLGESNSISAVHGASALMITTHSSPNDKSKLRYMIPKNTDTTASPSRQELDRKAMKLEQLIQADAFAYPPSHVSEALLQAYFTWFHPCFPIIDLASFSHLYASKSLSPLLLEAVLFIGASHCGEEALQRIGVADRQEMRSSLFHHTRDLYDADYEKDKTVVSQAVFLMSFWREGPMLEKDTRHWLGAAISLAQTKGMHRSSQTISFNDRRLRKKIWWSLYIRDRQCSAALGLPIRIRDEDCDIEQLQIEDFEEDTASNYLPFIPPQSHEHVLYFIHMTQLAHLLGKIILREFSPRHRSDLAKDKLGLKDELLEWEAELSPEMGIGAAPESFWASTLHLSYNNLYILLYRSAYLKEQNEGMKGDGQTALHAACRNTRIIEDMLSHELCRHGNVHLITSVFNSLCLHTLHLRRTHGTARKLSEYRAQICLLGLRELQKTWDVSNWVLQLFFQFLDKSTLQKILPAESEEVPLHQAKMAYSQSDTRIETESSNAGLPRSYRDETNAYALRGRNLSSGLDFASTVFGSKEAEDFSLFQLQPNLFQGDIFGGGLDQYYDTVLPDSLHTTGLE